MPGHSKEPMREDSVMYGVIRGGAIVGEVMLNVTALGLIAFVAGFFFTHGAKLAGA